MHMLNATGCFGFLYFQFKAINGYGDKASPIDWTWASHPNVQQKIVCG